ncbi:MAG TPA: YqiA/YcfP family alpha/beta fold hydrolase [Burkholderiales bacterium]|nr:YqiA/YcfP family alpha/beta fold hydrolase [Burkholderiales bacterium]
MIVYLHGFNSSPQSHKAQLMQRYMAERGLAEEFACPTLPHSPRDAVRLIRSVVDDKPVCYVGSSLGGFYATYMVETQGGKAVLINPAIEPHIGLAAFVGQQRNLYTGEPYELTRSHLAAWRELYVPGITAQRYLLLVETGDEVLDYRRAVERYAGAEQLVTTGGDHSLRSFPEHLPRILRFAGY